ncbi:MAG TPA: hypothetical protein VEQ58_23050 [Polyangiaceae bacterium]|nr:hypothetical protein [Polyangiaceae bacterium]
MKTYAIPLLLTIATWIGLFWALADSGAADHLGVALALLPLLFLARASRRTRRVQHAQSSTRR